MKNNVSYTSTLPKEVFQWLKNYADSKGRPMNTIIAEAVVAYKKQTKKEVFDESFKRAALDSEIQDMSEEGWEDYYSQVKRFVA